MDASHAGIEVSWIEFDEVVVLESTKETDSAELYESPGYPHAVGSYALICRNGMYYRETITLDGGHIMPILDASELRSIGLL